MFLLAEVGVERQSFASPSATLGQYGVYFRDKCAREGPDSTFNLVTLKTSASHKLRISKEGK